MTIFKRTSAVVGSGEIFLENDMVTVYTKNPYTKRIYSTVGRIHDIGEEKLALDVSSEYKSEINRISYTNITDIQRKQ